MAQGMSDTQALNDEDFGSVRTVGASLQPAIKETIGFDKVFCFRASFSRMFAGLMGPLLLGIGSGISISAGFGAFGFSVLLEGLNITFGTPLWLSQLLLTVAFYLIAWRWAKIPLGMGTLPALLLIGPAISLGAAVTPITLPFAGHILAFAVGLFVFAAGISLAAAASLGPDGVTALSLAAEKRHGVSVARANFVWNSLAIGTGMALGGHCGAATVIGLFSVPLLIKVFLPWLRAEVVRA